jgi:oligopeptide/dipeptide ABC transporter ATP-binding protein
MTGGEPILRVEHLVKEFPVKNGAFGGRSGAVHAVDDVSFDLRQGETLAIVGESGCGKSTLARCVTRLLEPTSGRITFEGRDITGLSRREMAPIRRDMMMIFQDPFGSLDPRMHVGAIIAEPLEVHGWGEGKKIRTRVQELLALVGLNPEHYNRYPHEFSGGQRQRIGIARALALRPALMLCDEPVSALDVSIQAQILNLFKDLQEEFGLTYLFIAHDLAVIQYISTRVAVMYLGVIVEISGSADLYRRPLHPYTQALLSAAPIPDPAIEKQRKRIILTGDVPSPDKARKGCYFYDRCWKRMDKCKSSVPRLKEVESGHQVACYLYHEPD